jgi:site-specific recombinase XerD
MGRLREEMKGDLELRGLSPETQKIYLYYVTNFSRYFNRSPYHLGKREIKEYLLHLLREKKASASTVNLCYSALKFLYARTLKRDEIMEKIPRLRSTKKLPVVLERQEVESLFSVMKNLKHRAILMLIYSSGLRLREASHLKGSDIDSKRMVLRIRQGKGRKDRYTLLSTAALEVLREYWRHCHPKEWLFPGRLSDKPLSVRSIQRVFKKARTSVSETLFELAGDPKHLGGQIGFICILHTWGQNLMDHAHIHCIVTGGGLSHDGKRWLSCRKRFFISVKVLSRLFRGKVLDYLKKSWESEELKFSGSLSNLQNPDQFTTFLKDLYKMEWVVYSKPPFNNTETLVDYLGRYIHRIAIGNHRILKMEYGKVFFLWRDYADGNKKKIMTLEASEFIRRFLLHVLPEKFVKVRYYGLLANRKSNTMLSQCRRLLDTVQTSNKNVNETWQEFLKRVCGMDLITCPFCKNGRMIRKEVIQPPRCNSPPQERRAW